MLHHLSIAVADLERSGRFYDAALGALGYARLWSDQRGIGYGPPGGGDKLALRASPKGVTRPSPGFHLALAAPGLRPHYGASYYAAFVFDPDEYAIEAVTKAS